MSLFFGRALQAVEVCCTVMNVFYCKVIQSATSKRDVTQLLHTKFNAVTVKEIQNRATDAVKEIQQHSTIFEVIYIQFVEVCCSGMLHRLEALVLHLLRCVKFLLLHLLHRVLESLLLDLLHCVESLLLHLLPCVEYLLQ